MNTQSLHFQVEELSILEISDFFKIHDEDYYEKLSDRVDINDYSQKLYESSVKFTLRDDFDLIGLSPCYFNNVKEKVGYISSLTIKDGFRSNKLGSNMITQISKYALNHGFNTVMVKIHYSNTISYQFYQKNGFKDFINDEDNGFRLLRLNLS